MVNDTDIESRSSATGSNEVKPGFSNLHLPEKLKDKHILELFSGDERASLRETLESRGATYTAMDLYNPNGDFSFTMDATQELPFLPNSFDFILMVSPPVWRGKQGIETNVVTSILKKCSPVLKHEPGNFIGALLHLDELNKNRLAKAIKNEQALKDYICSFEETSVQAEDFNGIPIGGNEWSLRLIVS